MIYQIAGVYHAQCDGCKKHHEAENRVRREVVNAAILDAWTFKFVPGDKDVKAWCPNCKRGMLRSGVLED